MEVVFYSTHCPKCKILEAKLKQKNVEYKEINDMEEITKTGFKTVPLLKVDGNLMQFLEATKWVNAL